jgi:nucleoside-diphosphate-sugar epimerase
MIKPRILVTGATGKTGSVVVSELLKAGYPVRALVHREDGRSTGLRALSGTRYYIDDHEHGAFELGAPTSDVLDVTGRPAEDFETIARRFAAPFRNQRTFGN